MYLWAPRPTSGLVSVTGQWGAGASQAVELAAGETSVLLKLYATVQQIELWWPGANGQR